VRFADEVQASFPAGLVLPPAMRLALGWMEDKGCVRRYTTGGRRYASLYPASVGDAGTAIIAFKTVEADHAAY
jgi:hypothetical protein